MNTSINEKDLQNQLSKWLNENNWKEITEQRESHEEIMIEKILRKQLAIINSQQLMNFDNNIQKEIINKAINELTKPYFSSLININKEIHQKLTEGINIEVRDSRVNPLIRFIDFDNLSNNAFNYQTEYIVAKKEEKIRLDKVILVNGIPLVDIELKWNVPLKEACQQVQRYKSTVDHFYYFNFLTIISNYHETLYGSIVAKEISNFRSWKDHSLTNSSLEIICQKFLFPPVFLEIMREFTIFEENEKRINKKIIHYHQYLAVQEAVKKIDLGKKKAGIIVHPQGTGKSLTMAFLASKITRKAPQFTVIIITDRRQLDEQIYETFSKASKLFGSHYNLNKIESKKELLNLKKTLQGGIFFITLQKHHEKDDYFNLINSQKDILLIVDEAHRSWFGKYASHARIAFPNAIFLGFTATPIDKNKGNSTYEVFGDQIHYYKMQTAIQDGLVREIVYEEHVLPIQADEEKLTSASNYYQKIKVEHGEKYAENELNKKLMKSIISNENRIKKITEKFHHHYQISKNNIPFEKAMFALHNREVACQIYQLLREKSEFCEKVALIITSDSTDSEEMSKIIPGKLEREKLIKEFRQKEGKIKIALVVDMLLTGFDMPILGLLYLDKKFNKEHGFFQAICRVNRAYPEKKNGLVIDFLGNGEILEKVRKEKKYTYQHIINKEVIIARFRENLTNLTKEFDIKKWLEDFSKESKFNTLENIYKSLSETDQKFSFSKKNESLLKDFKYISENNNELLVEKEKSMMGLLQEINNHFLKKEEEKYYEKEKASELLEKKLREIFIPKDSIIKIDFTNNVSDFFPNKQRMEWEKRIKVISQLSIDNSARDLYEKVDTALTKFNSREKLNKENKEELGQKIKEITDIIYIHEEERKKNQLTNWEYYGIYRPTSKYLDIIVKENDELVYEITKKIAKIVNNYKNKIDFLHSQELQRKMKSEMKTKIYHEYIKKVKLLVNEEKASKVIEELVELIFDEVIEKEKQLFRKIILPNQIPKSPELIS